MDNLDSIFPGRKTMIDQYVTSKKDEIEDSKKKDFINYGEMI